MKMQLTQGRETLLDREDFERLSTWKWKVLKTKTGDYACRNDKGKTSLLHRVITGAMPGQVVDHINRNTLDNRRCNLRLCNRAQNMANGAGRKKSTSKYRGVSWSSSRKKWVVQLKFDNGTGVSKTRLIGRFNSEAEAAMAYNRKAFEIYGEFALLNDIGDESVQHSAIRDSLANRLSGTHAVAAATPQS